MLQNLSIRNVVLIESLDLGFESGLSVLTGETGSGKSILLDALGLAIGVRADIDLVRQGAKQSSVTAEFELGQNNRVEKILDELGLETETRLVLRRVVSDDGRSRAFVNDQSVSVSALRQIGEALVEVHGQLESHGLLDSQTHGQFVDSYGHNSKLCEVTGIAFRAWRDAVAAHLEAVESIERAARDDEYLRHAIEELNRIDPQEDEEQSLADQRMLLMHGEKLAAAMNDAFTDMNQGNGVEASLRSAVQKLERVSEHAGGRLNPAVEALERALVEASDGMAELERSSRELNLDPAELDKVEERLFALRALARKYNTDINGLRAMKIKMEQQLAALNAGQESLEKLRKEAELARAGFIDAAAKLTLARKKAAAKMEKAVTRELPPLKLEAAIFCVLIEPLDEKDWSENGCERVTFQIQTNPNTNMGALNKVASGGELARVMLALKVVLADTEAVPTIIFDEVDAGIGGAAAAAVGQRLVQLADRFQVLVVTHSPQVAARGSSHWRIHKNDKKGANLTLVDPLDKNDRIEEIARMLAGAKITDEARRAADSLLNGDGK